MIPKGAYFEILRVELVRLRLWGFIRIDGKALSAFKNFIRVQSSHLRFKFCHCGGILLTWQGLACKASVKFKDLDAKFISVFSDATP